MFHFYHSELYYDYIKFIPLASKLYYQEKTIVSSGVSNTEIHTHKKDIFRTIGPTKALYFWGKR
jgi:hypothetical protein